MRQKFTPEQLESLFTLFNFRELSEEVREAVRLVNNHGYTMELTNVRRQTVSDAIDRLEQKKNQIIDIAKIFGMSKY
ncbi:hypothetical protein OPW39_15645 [Vibrio europaeus]|uniref:hypothetical protein n=1 Tax=Vibrio europaeus TaxID=300876 RepID=UPI00233F79BD|nr:hypothetical protein [Vibrio europaeus]MDC5870241.1 hypothetical protein [Vibrio europaeus]